MRPQHPIEELYAFYVFGASFSYVGRVYGMSSSRVKQLFLEAELPVRDADEAIALYNAGGNDAADRRMTTFFDSQIAQQDPTTPAGSAGSAPADQEADDSLEELEWRVAALRQLNWPVATIAQALGISKRRTRELLRRNGLQH